MLGTYTKWQTLVQQSFGTLRTVRLRVFAYRVTYAHTKTHSQLSNQLSPIRLPSCRYPIAVLVFSRLSVTESCRTCRRHGISCWRSGIAAWVLLTGLLWHSLWPLVIIKSDIYNKQNETNRQSVTTIYWVQYPIYCNKEGTEFLNTFPTTVMMWLSACMYKPTAKNATSIRQLPISGFFFFTQERLCNVLTRTLHVCKQIVDFWDKL